MHNAGETNHELKILVGTNKYTPPVPRGINDSATSTNTRGRNKAI